MKSTLHPLTLAVAMLWGVLLSGCATTGATSCRPGDATVACCIKKYPLSPAESCAASRAEILETLMMVEAALEAETAYEATRQPEDADADEGADDFANNAHLPEWKQRCIKGFVRCENQRWTGDCYACLRRCEGQHEWPTHMCRPSKTKR